MPPLLASGLLCIITAWQLVAGQDNGTTCTNPSGFLHGVASGDPLADRVVLWTRFTPANRTSTYEVRYFVSRGPDATGLVSNGTLQAGPERDFTVKVDAAQLQPNTQYYYWFTQGNYSSQLGVTRTAPVAASQRESVRFLFVSCANWGYGYFNVYNMSAKVKDIDFLVFLGDYIYEYGNDEYPTQGQRVRDGLTPPNHLHYLDEFRARHALFKADLPLQNMHRRVPLIAIWDDHDVMNNGWFGGAPDFNGTEFNQTWDERVAAGVRAWHEWLPIRDSLTVGAQEQPTDLLDIYRAFDYADILTLVVGEQRFAYRTQQYDYRSDPYIQALENNDPEEWDNIPNLDELRAGYIAALEAPNRTIFGPQVESIQADFAESAARNTTWQILGNTVIMGPRRTPDIETALNEKLGPLAGAVLEGLLNVATSELLSGVESINAPARILVGTGRYHDSVIVDGWDGYQYERNQLYNIFANSTNNAVVLAGDSHNAWAYNLLDSSGVPVGVEFDSPSITPPGLDQLTDALPTEVDAGIITRGMAISNPETLVYSDISSRGAVIVTAYKDRLQAEYWYARDVTTRELEFSCGVAFEVVDGNRTLNNATCTAKADMFFDLGSASDPLPAKAQGFTAAVNNTTLTSCGQNGYMGNQDSSARQLAMGAQSILLLAILLCCGCVAVFV